LTYRAFAVEGHTHTQAQSHGSPDTDTATTALHHTLGTQAFQAAAGNHTHAEIFPVGCIAPYAGATAPSGWLVCDGSAVSTTQYAALFAVCGTRYNGGSSPGAGLFRLPNLQGRVVAGVSPSDATYSTLGATGGAKTITLTEAQMPSHKHTATTSGFTVSGQTISGLTVSGMTFTGDATSSDGSHSHTSSGSVGGEGGHGHGVSLGTRVTAVTATGVAFQAGSLGNVTRIRDVDVTTNNAASTTISLLGETQGAHSHTFSGAATTSDGGHTHTVSGTVTTGTVAGGTISGGTVTGTVNVANTGSGSAVTVLDPFLVLNYIIKAL
jgi:microcystin-dependent protein